MRSTRSWRCAPCTPHSGSTRPIPRRAERADRVQPLPRRLLAAGRDRRGRRALQGPVRALPGGVRDGGRAADPSASAAGCSPGGACSGRSCSTRSGPPARRGRLGHSGSGAGRPAFDPTARALAGTADAIAGSRGGDCSRHRCRRGFVPARVAARGGGERAARAGEAVPRRREEPPGGDEAVHRGSARRPRQRRGRGRARLRAALAGERAQGPGLAHTTARARRRDPGGNAPFAAGSRRRAAGDRGRSERSRGAARHRARGSRLGYAGAGGGPCRAGGACRATRSLGPVRQSSRGGRGPRPRSRRPGALGGPASGAAAAPGGRRPGRLCHRRRRPGRRARAAPASAPEQSTARARKTYVVLAPALKGWAATRPVWELRFPSGSMRIQRESRSFGSGQCTGMAAGQHMLAIVFWIAVGCILHTYVIYPLLLVALDAIGQAWGAWGYLGGNERRRPPARLGLPNVSVLIAAYNEQVCIGRRIENLLEQDYPADKLEILVGSDASTDETDAIVQRYAARGVKLSRAERSGKAGVLSRLVGLAKGEVMVMTDANTDFERDAIRRLVQPLRDEEVGLVCGRLRLHSPAGAPVTESAYWKLESVLKLYESRRGCVMGANGGIYAVRRHLFPPLPAGTVVDDFVAALRVLQSGYEVRYEPEAVAHEEAAPGHADEYRRRVRIAAGCFRALSHFRDLLEPRHGFTAFALWSHKVLRWLVPQALLVALVTNALLAPRSALYALFLLAQCGAYTLAALGLLGTSPRHLRKLTDPAAHFVEMNAALLVGFLKFSRGTQGQTWTRTERAKAA